MNTIPRGSYVLIDDEEYGPFRDVTEALTFQQRKLRGLATRLYVDSDGFVYDSTEAWQ